MKLSELRIKNFKRIGKTECVVRIDDIVVLIGQNNSGKSTVLDAYEAFASGGESLDSSFFHNKTKDEAIEIAGTFTDLNDQDLETLGKKWKFDDPSSGACIRVRWLWEKPDAKGIKQSFNPSTAQYEPGGVGGWDTLLQSRIPQPIRIRPSDSFEVTQQKMLAMLKEHVKAQLKAESQSKKAVIDELEKLTGKLLAQSKQQFDEVSSKITQSVSGVFPGASVEVVLRSKDNIDEKILAADSFIQVSTKESGAAPLALQGTGIQRALLWSVLSVMADGGLTKKKGKADHLPPKILLIDEPEAFLHPPTVRNARDALYDFALKNSSWQVIATTHSPIFIDLSRDHTTIVRVDPAEADQRYISTDRVSFDADERMRLQMIRACNPIVNEFFFYDHVVIVEGPTEQLVVQHVAKKLNLEVHVVNCLGKANLPLFCRVLNHFRVPYLVIHDSDTPRIKRKGVFSASGMWTINKNIRDAAGLNPANAVFVQFPHFEGEFYSEELQDSKVDRILTVLADENCEDYKRILETYQKVLRRELGVLIGSEESFNQKRIHYIASRSLESDPYWI